MFEFIISLNTESQDPDEILDSELRKVSESGPRTEQGVLGYIAAEPILSRLFYALNDEAFEAIENLVQEAVTLGLRIALEHQEIIDRLRSATD